MPISPDYLEITVNGSLLQLPSGSTVVDLMHHLGLVGQRVAVERNQEVIPRSNYAQTVLVSGDRLEIIRAVGGG
ncbi:MAG: sulfur carrier protein ThiS [Acidithiobacillus sp.]|nr:sulfur carrier protein ThiS [Acidithiobacillus sp.]